MNSTGPSAGGGSAGGAPPGAGGAGGRPTLDQMLWMGIGTNPGKMLSWSMLGSTLTLLFLSKIVRDTVKYYDYCGFRGKAKAGSLVATALFFAFVHAGITCAQTFKLSQYAFIDYAHVSPIDNYCNSASNLLGGCFNFGAAVFFTHQVFELSGRKWWLLGVRIPRPLLQQLLSVAVKGFHTPRPSLETISEFRAFNIGRVPYFLAWGGFSLAGDVAICASMTYYLLRMKDSIVHRQKRLLYKLQTLVLGTMLPPCVFCLVLAISQRESRSNIGDYRRIFQYLYPMLYLMSPLHSIITRIELREYIKNRDDDTTNPDSFPLSPQPQMPDHQWKAYGGQDSTIHIDPLRGKERRANHLEDGAEGGEKKLPAVIGLRGEIPCKRTFGAPEHGTDTTISFAPPPNMSQSSIKKKKVASSSLGAGYDKPSKSTFGAVDLPTEGDHDHDVGNEVDDSRPPNHPYGSDGMQDSEEEVWRNNLFYDGRG